MHYFYQHRSALDVAQLKDLSARFEALTDVHSLCKILGVTEATLKKHIDKPEYHTFYIPKPGGRKRLIQHPGTGLKAIQQILNRYLQAVYFGVKSDAAHGFIVSPKDELQPRSIYTNAMQHCKSEWFLNVDLENFFHTVTTTHLKNLFRYTFFFPPALTGVLTGLCAYEKRLPMGAPTSPVLSNLACIFLDHQMSQLAQGAEAQYTRYADDLTFSFSQPPPPDFVNSVRCIVLHHGFTVNEQKLRLQPRLEQPEVTGLVMGKGPLPALSPAWLKRLKEEVKILRWLMSEAVRERGIFHAYVFDKFRQSVQGQVAFVGFMLGKESRAYRKLAAKVG